MPERDESTDNLGPEVVGLRLPKDPTAAATRLMDLTKQGDTPPFWVPSRGHLWLPAGVRGKREVAIAVITNDSFRMGYVELKYHDGTVVSLKTKDLHYGDAVMPGEITQKWLLCRPTERDLRGKQHE